MKNSTILDINAYLKFIEELLCRCDEDCMFSNLSEKIKTNFNLKCDYKFLNQNFGIIRLIPLLFIREKIKDKKSSYKDNKKITIIRHAFAHGNIEISPQKEYIFTCDKGKVKLNFEDFMKFIHRVENEFYRVHSSF